VACAPNEALRHSPAEAKVDFAGAAVCAGGPPGIAMGISASCGAPCVVRYKCC